MKIIIDDTIMKDIGIEEVIDQVMSTLSETKQNLYSSDELTTRLNLVMCKNKLAKLLNTLPGSRVCLKKV